MIDYRFWRLDTPHASSAKDVAGVLEKAREEYLSTNTPAVRVPGVNGTTAMVVDAKLRDAIVRQMAASIRAAVVVAEALGEGAFVHASIAGHVIEDADNGIDERTSVSVDKVPSPRANDRVAAAVQAKLVA